MTTEEKVPEENSQDSTVENVVENASPDTTVESDATKDNANTEASGAPSESSQESVAPPTPADPQIAAEPASAEAPAEDSTSVSEEVKAEPVAEENSTSEAAGAPASVPAETETEPAAEATSEESPAAESTPPVAASAETAETSARVKQKLGASKEDRPVGSVDLQTMRPEAPSASAPIEIPDDDDLTADLEAEISAAMSTDAPAPVTTVAAPVEVFGDAAEGEKAAAEQEEVGPGSQVTGTVQQIHADDVFINAGLVSDVVVSLKQFPEDKKPSVGDSLTVVVENVDGDGIFRARLPQAKTKARGNWDALSVGQVVDCQVTGTNKGGLQVTVSNLRGFLPASQVDLGYVSNLESYVGQKISVQITEVNPRKRNLVVSRRVLLQAEREDAQAGFWESMEPGQDLPGTVKTIKNYGAFVNLGPIDGFLHVGEISWSRINHPNEVLKEGQEIQVRVLRIDKEKNRISLGMKQLVQNPWQGLGERYPSERVVSGKVSRVADFGAFVELEPGVEGLVHISELAWRRVGSVNEVLSVGDERDFKVLEVDQKRRRVSLSLKALEQKPESVRKAEAEEEARPVRKANPNLRGGMGGSKDGGGLFGNPSDFS